MTLEITSGVGFLHTSQKPEMQSCFWTCGPGNSRRQPPGRGEVNKWASEPSAPRLQTKLLYWASAKGIRDQNQLENHQTHSRTSEASGEKSLPTNLQPPICSPKPATLLRRGTLHATLRKSAKCTHFKRSWLKCTLNGVDNRVGVGFFFLRAGFNQQNRAQKLRAWKGVKRGPELGTEKCFLKWWFGHNRQIPTSQSRPQLAQTHVHTHTYRRRQGPRIRSAVAQCRQPQLAPRRPWVMTMCKYRRFPPPARREAVTSRHPAAQVPCHWLHRAVALQDEIWRK